MVPYDDKKSETVCTVCTVCTALVGLINIVEFLFKLSITAYKY